jgi:hypothetical protein
MAIAVRAIAVGVRPISVARIISSGGGSLCVPKTLFELMP